MTCLKLSAISCFLPCSSAEKAPAPGNEESDLRSVDNRYTDSSVDADALDVESTFHLFPSYISDHGRRLPAHENGRNTLKYIEQTKYSEHSAFL